MSKVKLMLHDKVLAELENAEFVPNGDKDDLMNIEIEYNLNLLAAMVKEALYSPPPLNRAYKYVLVHPDFLPSIRDAKNLIIYGLPILFTKDLPSVGAEVI